MKTIVPLVLALGLLAGCGGTTAPAGGTLSCDIVDTGVHRCLEDTWTTGVYPSASFQADCASRKGTVGAGCARGGAVVGCQTASSAGAVPITTTEWFYSGKPSDYQMACAGGKLISP